MKTYKFYQPITVHINRDGRPVDDIEELELIDGIPYVEQMNEAIQKDLEYTEGKGLVRHLFWSPKKRTKSVYPSIEVYNQKLYCVITFEAVKTFRKKDISLFSYWVESEMIIDWSYDFEQTPLKTKQGDIYMHFFQNNGPITVMKEEEFERKILKKLRENHEAKII